MILGSYALKGSKPFNKLHISYFEMINKYTLEVNETGIKILQNSQGIEFLCQSLFLLDFSPTQVFFFECFEIFKNNFFTEHPRVTASVNGLLTEATEAAVFLKILLNSQGLSYR